MFFYCQYQRESLVSLIHPWNVNFWKVQKTIDYANNETAAQAKENLKKFNQDTLKAIQGAENSPFKQIQRKLMKPLERQTEDKKRLRSYMSAAKDTTQDDDFRLGALQNALELSGELKSRAKEQMAKNRMWDVTQSSLEEGSSEAFKLENRLYNQYSQRMEDLAKQSLRTEKEANRILKQIADKPPEKARLIMDK